MRRYAFYLAIALLAFGIGFYFVYVYSIRNADIIYEPLSQTISEPTEITGATKIGTERLTCNDKSIQPFWDELKKHESFKNLDELYYWYDNGAVNSHDCSEFFRVSEDKDLNGDGREEYFVQGINYGFCSMSGECDFYIFQLQDGKYRKILFGDYSLDQKALKSVTKDYFDIETRTNDRLGDNSIFVYKFDGKRYKLTQCFTRILQVFKNGDIKKFEPPLITHEKCPKN